MLQLSTRCGLGLVVLLLFAGPVHAQVELAQEGDSSERWKLEEVGLRFVVFDQKGRGFQSQAQPDAQGRGVEDSVIFEPLARFLFRQNERLTHEVYIPVDVVSAASPDALDAMSTASALNQALTLDVTSAYTPDDDQTLSANYGFHVEETLRSWFVGAGYTRELAEDNATVSLVTSATLDFFDNLAITGRRMGRTSRITASGDASFSQVLSPTTVASVGYGVTVQRGTLEQTWNSAPLQNGRRVGENLPKRRIRQAFSTALAQHVPATRSTIRANYRYYRDDTSLKAHTAQAQVYQYLGRHLLGRATYRYHDQSGVGFFGSVFENDIASDELRTADSDLAPFSAHEVGAKLAYFINPIGPSWRANTGFDVAFRRYKRSNNLAVNVFSLGYTRRY